MNSVAVPPSAPKISLPRDACDAHTHVFGPLERFPLAVTGSYDPPDTPFETHRAMLDRMGFSRAVLVQPAPYAFDCSALLDACARAPERLRGIAVAGSDTTGAALHDLKRGGIRGLRFVEVPDPQGGGRYRGSVGFDELRLLAPRMAEAGLHAQLWADCARIAADAEELLSLGIPLVVDHIGRPDVTRGANDPAFARLVSLAAENHIWIKLTVCRASKEFPDYDDVRPLHDALIAAAPGRLLWGSDWPHVRMGALTPDAGHLVDLFDRWIGHDAALRQQILVDNPRVLYGFA
jgi:predicted TIM-barrel fold metal-dependent hydrolase